MELNKFLIMLTGWAVYYLILNAGNDRKYIMPRQFAAGLILGSAGMLATAI